MQTIVFYGASDDLVEVEGDAPGCDEYPADGEPREFTVTSGEGRMLVTVFWGGHGTWSVAPGILQEGDAFPGWPLRFGLRTQVFKGTTGPEPYSVKMEVDVPDDARVEAT